MSNEGDKIILDSETIFPFTKAKMGLSNYVKSNTILKSVSASPKKVFKEDKNFGAPEFDISLSSLSTQIGSTFSLSSKSNFFIAREQNSEIPIPAQNIHLEMHGRKCSYEDQLSANSKNKNQNPTVSFQLNKIEKEVEFNLEQIGVKVKKESTKNLEFNSLINSQKKNFKEDLDVPELDLDSNFSNNEQKIPRKKKSAKLFDTELKSLTNREDIRDFHENTDEYMKLMSKILINNNEDFESKKVNLDDKYIRQIINGEKKVAVIDLDETLIHREFENYEDDCDSIIEVTVLNQKVKIGIYLRPHLIECLKEIQKNYIMILFTASQKIYADKVLELIDPENEFFACRFYRDSCRVASVEESTIYIKDLEIFKNIPLEKVVIIDDIVLSFSNQIDNGIPILPFYKNKNDNELKCLVGYLNHLKNCEDVRVENRNIIKLSEYYQSCTSCADFDSSSNEEDYNEIQNIKREPENKNTNISYSYDSLKYILESEFTNSEYSDNMSSSISIYKNNNEFSDSQSFCNKYVNNEHIKSFNKKNKNKKKLFKYLEELQKRSQILFKK